MYLYNLNIKQIILKIQLYIKKKKVFIRDKNMFKT